MGTTAAEIIDAIIVRETDKYTNDPTDRGGPTKYGITQATLSRFRGSPQAPEDVQNLTREQAVEVYQKLYVDPFLRLAAISPSTLGLLVDSGVQHGTERAGRWLQAAVGCSSVDGILGSETILKWTPYGAGTRDQTEVYRAVLRSRIKFYAAILHDDPSQTKYANGWFARVCEFV